jgi:hypothetical protein
VPRVIEPVHIVSGFREQVCVTSLATGHIENARVDGKAEKLDDSRGLRTVALQRKDRLVLEEVPGIEVGFPPLLFFSQKKTGSL